MRSSFIAGINALGSIYLLHYIYNNLPVFNWHWSISAIALLAVAVLSALVLHFKTLLAIGASGTFMFLQKIVNSILVEFLNKNCSLLENIIIAFILLLVITIAIEILLSDSMSVQNTIFNVITAILTIAIIQWVLPLIAETTKLTVINTLGVPIVLIIFFVLIILIDFDAKLKEDKIKTKTNLKKPNIKNSKEI